MTPYKWPTRFLLLFVMLSLAPVVCCQGNSTCEIFYCTSYAYASGASISGYVQYYDNSEDWYLGIDAYMSGPTGDSYLGSDEGYDSATVYINGYSVGANGQWFLEGDPWTPELGYDGDTSYEVDIVQQPTSETTTVCCLVDAGYNFTVVLQPSYFNFDAYTTAESISSPTDSCYDYFHLLGPVSASSAPPLHTSNNYYSDTIASTDIYISTYQAAISSSSSHANCSWGVFQAMSYAGMVPYASEYPGQSLTSGSVTTCRVTTCSTIYQIERIQSQAEG